MAEKFYIPIIIGTRRKGRLSEHVADYILDIAKKFSEADFEIIDPKDYDFPDDGRDETRDPRFTKLVAKADGFFIVVPEYNHGYSGSLKRMLDTEYDGYRNKAVALAGVSDGPWGGVRAIETLIHVLKAIGLCVIQYDVQFPLIKDKVDEKTGEIKDPDGELRKKTESTLESLIWMTKTLKYGRENF